MSVSLIVVLLALYIALPLLLFVLRRFASGSARERATPLALLGDFAKNLAVSVCAVALGGLLLGELPGVSDDAIGFASVRLFLCAALLLLVSAYLTECADD